ncbi:hypothetical protein TruAng_004058 [Truncatella angustata]|nr:hypothetical protein TruAng_004058 [Truncatella angustata]
MSSAEADFLFINKEPSSLFLSRSSAVENSQILMHIHQRRRNGQKPQKWTKFASHLSVKAETQKQIDPNRTGLFRLYPRNNATDPFYCTVAATDAGIHSLLDHAFTHATIPTFLAEAYASPAVVQRRSRMRHVRTLSARKRQCVDNPALMYSTLAYGSSCLGWVTGQLDKKKSPEYFMDRALAEVRMQFSEIVSRADTWSLLTVYALAITELWIGLPNIWRRCPDRQAAILQTDVSCALRASRTHLKALLRMIEHAGGWSAVDSYIRESAILADKYLSFTEATRPLTNYRAWDPGPMGGCIERTLVTPRFKDDRLGESLLQVSMCLELRSVVEEVIGYVQFAEESWSSPVQMTEMQRETESWLFLRLQALIFRLQCLENLVGIEECIRIIMTVFLLETTQYYGSWLCSLMTIQRAHSQLLEIYAVADQDFAFWFFCTVAMSHEPSREREWGAKNLAALRSNMCLELSEAAFAAKMETYLYIPRMQGAQLRDTVKRLKK